MPRVLTSASQVSCPHGGQALLATSDGTLLAGGSPVLLESDVHVVVGCPLTVATVYTPCVRIDWEAAATGLSVDGVAVLLETSLGLCVNAAGVPQGLATVAAPAAELDSV